MKRTPFLTILILLFLLGCTAAPSQTALPILIPATRVPRASPTATITLVRTPTRAFTASPFPTSTPSASSTPEPSPASISLGGLEIIYTQDQALYAANVAGQHRIASFSNEEGYPGCPQVLALSSDGKWLAYTDSYELVITHPDAAGSPLRIPSSHIARYAPAANGGTMTAAGLSWVPGIDLLLFTSMEAGIPFPAPNDDLFQVDAAGGNLQRLLRAGEGGRIYPAPGAAWVGLSNTTRISILDLKTGELRNVLDFPAIQTHTEYGYIPNINWNADGTAFLVSIPPVDPVLDPSAPTAIWRVDAHSGKAQRLSEIYPGFQARLIYFSSDQSRLAYEFRQDLSGPMELHLADVTSGSDRILLSGNYRLEGWTPSGRLLLYDNAARQRIGLASDGSPQPLKFQGVRLGGVTFRYQALDNIIASLRSLDDSRKICQWIVLSPGSRHQGSFPILTPPTSTPRLSLTPSPLSAH
jgi:hypothetical protein